MSPLRTPPTRWLAAAWAVPLALALLLVNAAPLPAVPPARAYGGGLGIQGGWALDNFGNTDFPDGVVSHMPAMQQAGAHWIRINFRLGDCYRDWTSPGCNGRTALEAYDEVVDAAHRHNLQILGLLSNESWHGTQADWNRNNAETTRGSGDNTFIIDYAVAASVVARHFVGRINHWEVWNEPNAWDGAAAGLPVGSSYIYPSNYAWLLRRTYLGVKQGNPRAAVIMGGLFAHDFGGVSATVIENGVVKRVVRQGMLPGSAAYYATPGMPATTCSTDIPSGADYLCVLYYYGLTRGGWTRTSTPFDHLGQHLYINQINDTTHDRVAMFLEDLRRTYLLHEPNGPKRVWVTEVGWSREGVSPELQAENLRVAFETFMHTPYVERAFWFVVQDIPNAEHYYGLYGADGTPVPALQAFQGLGG